MFEALITIAIVYFVSNIIIAIYFDICRDYSGLSYDMHNHMVDNRWKTFVKNMFFGLVIVVVKLWITQDTTNKQRTIKSAQTTR